MKSAKTWMRVLGILLMVIASIPEAWAKTTTVDGITWTYTVSNGEASLGYHAIPTSTSGAITIPSTLDGYRVSSIGYSAFSGYSGLASVAIPDSVTNIAYYAFSGCSGLTNVTIPEGVTSIGYSAFSGCSGLTSVTIPASVTSIVNFVFYDCSGLTNVTLSDGVTSIGYSAFAGCSSLMSVTIPASVTSIGNRAFSNCSRLTNIVVDLRNLSYSSLDGVLFSGDKTSLIVFPAGKTGAYTIPDGVKIIKNSAFYNCCGVTNVTICESVTNIGYAAFYACSGLANITVVSDNPFYSSLDGVLFSSDMTSLIFFPSGRQDAYAIPDSVTSIKDDAFSGCIGLTSITIGGGVTNIGASAFYGCRSLERVRLWDSVASIGREAFAKCTRLTRFEVSDDNMAYTSRDGVLFTKDMETLVCCPGDKTGVYCIPDGVKSIDYCAFSWCAGLKSVVVPASLQSIGHYAFLGCSGLETLLMPLSWAGKSLGYPYLRAKCKLLFGTQGVESEGETAWHYFIQDGSSRLLGVEGSGETSIPGQLGGCPVTSIAPYAFFGSERLTGVTIPDGVTNIGTHAFSGCVGLDSVEIPAGVTEIGDYAFSGCKGLTNLVIPDTVQRIGQHAFHGCTGLAELTMGSGVAEIGKWAFGKCNKLSELVLPDGVESIGDFAFAGCDALASVTIPASVTELGEHPFAKCKGLVDIAVEPGNEAFESEAGVLFSKGKTVLLGVPAGREGVFVLPDEVTELGGHAFDGCAGLTTLEASENNASFASRSGILFSKDMERMLVCPAGKTGAVAVPDGVKRIEARALADCRKLTSLMIPESVTSMGTNSLHHCDGLLALFVPPTWEDEGSWKKTARLQAKVEIIYARLEFEIVDGVEWHFAVENGEAVVLPGDYGTNVEIPAMLGGHPVTRIGEYAFYGCEGLESMVLSDSVRDIGKWAFGGCKGLKSISIPEGVTHIGDRAFFGCSGLPEAAIPNSVKSIGVNAFYGNSDLTALEVGGSNATYASQDGVLFSKDMGKLLWCPDGKTGEYTIPDTVKTLAYRAFGDCIGLTGGTLPGSVEKIGRNAFYGCRMLSVLYVPASWEGEPGWLEMLERAKLPPECRIVYLKDNPEETTSTTPVPVPFEWLKDNAKEILEENGGDYEAAAWMEVSNGMELWTYYLIGLDPASEDAAFTVKLEFVDGKPVVKWDPDLNEDGEKKVRTYRVWGKKDIMDEDWTDMTDVEDLKGEGWRFFRVGVEMAE